MVLQNSSFESLVVSWLMRDGWQVFIPILDNGHKTDLLISDGPKYYRIQVKTVDAATESVVVENRWPESNLDCVVYNSGGGDLVRQQRRTVGTRTKGSWRSYRARPAPLVFPSGV